MYPRSLGYASLPYYVHPTAGLPLDYSRHMLRSFHNGYNPSHDERVSHACGDLHLYPCLLFLPIFVSLNH